MDGTGRVPGDFALTAEVLPSGVHVRAAGEIDLATAPAFNEGVHAAAARDPRVPVLLDLSEVEYMDSSGLRVLRGLGVALGERLVLERPSASVLRVLDLAGMSGHFRRAGAV